MLSSVDSTCKSTLLLALTDKSASAEDPLLEQYDRHELIPPSSLSATRLSPSVPLSLPLPPPPLSCSRAPAFLQLVVSLLSLPPQPRAIRGSGLSGWPTVPQPLHPTRARSLPTSLPSSNEGGLRCVGRCRCYRCGGRDGARAMTRAASPSSKPNLSYMPCHLPALPLSLPLLLALSLSLSLCSTSSWASGLSRPFLSLHAPFLLREEGEGATDASLSVSPPPSPSLSQRWSLFVVAAKAVLSISAKFARPGDG